MTRPPHGSEPTGPGVPHSGGESERPGSQGDGLDAATTRITPTEAVAGRPDADPEADPVRGPGRVVADDEHNPSLNKLGRTLKRGASISAAMLFVTQVISLAQTVVVARLLSPAEIGVFTLGTLFANFLVTLAGGGMKAALIQRGHDIEKAANTAFYASLVTGVVMATGALAAAPLLGMFFGDRMVALIAAATSGTLLIHALLNVPEALMQRRFNFKRKLIVDPITAGTFAVGTVTAVSLGYGVWGMVFGLYLSQVSTLIASWTLAGWLPGKESFCFRTWREMARFAYPLIVQGVASNIRDITQQSIVGRALDIATAGQYRYGRRIGTLPGQAIIQVASYVLFPAFSRIAQDAVRFHRGFLRALRLLWTVTLPMGVLLVAVGAPAIVVLLGEQWAPAGVFVAAMAGFGPGTALNAVGVESIKGAGRSRLIHWVTGTSIVVGIGGLLALLPFGLLGVGLAASIEGLVSGALTLVLARPLVGATWGELGRVIVPPVVAAAVAGVATGALEHLVLHSASRPVAVGLLFLVLDFLVFAVIYLAVLAVLAPATVRELRALLAKFRRRRAGGGPGGEGGQEGVDDGGPTGPPGPDVPPVARYGEDDLLDAPTVLLGLRLDPQTERMLHAERFPGSPPDAAGRPRPAAPRPPLPPAPTTPVSAVRPGSPPPSAPSPGGGGDARQHDPANGDDG
ncbi:MAG: polysaccharide biosynthesis protein, partial [Actinomycetospora sp.]|nr:polysaccharide biosynthesis protein [Actinomycetospora sp.]